MYTEIMQSNLKTMAICAVHDARQAQGTPYTIPSYQVRYLRAKLILEETLETILALGFDAQGTISPEEVHAPNLEDIIDGCCDLNYVLTGTLVSCGVPDMPHIAEVCRANEDKFPGGQAIFREDGKFQKPEGWQPPDHARVQREVIDASTDV
jgi:hypothetical protein